MSVLVTGAAGFIGGHLVDHLLENDQKVICFIQPEDDLRWLHDKPVTLHFGDITNRESIEPAVRGDIEYVFHLAAVIHSVRSEEYVRVNVKGTENLMMVCCDRIPNMKRFVFVSSVSAMGPCRGQKELTETDECCPDNDYGRSKLAAEDILNRCDTLPSTIFRLGLVYGPRHDFGLFPLFKIASRKMRFLMGELETNPIYVEDAVCALWMAACSCTTQSRTYILAGDRVCTYNELVEKIEDSLGVRTWKIRVGGTFISALDALICVHARVVGRTPVIDLRRFQYRERTRFVYDISRIISELNFTPEIDLEPGIRQTVEWYREAGWIR